MKNSLFYIKWLKLEIKPIIRQQRNMKCLFHSIKNKHFQAGKKKRRGKKEKKIERIGIPIVDVSKTEEESRRKKFLESNCLTSFVVLNYSELIVELNKSTKRSFLALNKARRMHGSKHFQKEYSKNMVSSKRNKLQAFFLYYYFFLNCYCFFFKITMKS